MKELNWFGWTLLVIGLLPCFNLFAQENSFAWAAHFSGDKRCEVISVSTDSYGNIYTAGNFSGTVDFDPGPGKSEITCSGYSNLFIQKMNSKGELLWVQRIQPNNFHEPMHIDIDSVGNVVVVGAFTGTTDFDPGEKRKTLSSIDCEGCRNVFVLKLDAQGNFRWVKHIQGVYTQVVAVKPKIDFDGNVYVYGQFSSAIDFDPQTESNQLLAKGDLDGFILKLDSNGDYQWSNHLHGQRWEGIGGLDVDRSGSVYCSGFFERSGEFRSKSDTLRFESEEIRSLIVQKLDQDGNFMETYQWDNFDFDRQTAIIVGNDGAIYLTGSYTGKDVDFDPGSEKFTLPYDEHRRRFILSLDKTGIFRWAKQVHAQQLVPENSIVQDPEGNIYILGDFEGSIDFNPGSAENNYTAKDESDVYLLKLTSDGEYLSTLHFPGYAEDSGKSIAVDSEGNLVICGSFEKTIDLDPSEKEELFQSAGKKNGFVVKLQ